MGQVGVAKSSSPSGTSARASWQGGTGPVTWRMRSGGEDRAERAQKHSTGEGPERAGLLEAGALRGLRCTVSGQAGGRHLKGSWEPGQSWVRKLNVKVKCLHCSEGPEGPRTVLGWREAAG